MLNTTDSDKKIIQLEVHQKESNQKYQCNKCKFMFYNSKICLRCGSFDVSMIIED